MRKPLAPLAAAVPVRDVEVAPSWLVALPMPVLPAKVAGSGLMPPGGSASAPYLRLAPQAEAALSVTSR